MIVTETYDIVRTLGADGRIRNWLVKPGGSLQEVERAPLKLQAADGDYDQIDVFGWQPVDREAAL